MPEPVDYAVGVAKKKRGSVDKHSFALRGFDFESPQDGLSERLFDCPALIRIRRDGAVAIVGLNQQNLRPDALEADNVRASQLPAIEAQRIRADAGGKRDLI